jgi:hypothetical protein
MAPRELEFVSSAYGHDNWRSVRRKRDDLSGGQIRINAAVDLKNALGQVEADGGNLHSGWLPFCS